MFPITRRYNSEEARQSILSASVRLILEKGYLRTTVSEILKEAHVSASTFQNLFHTKDGVLMELVEAMFHNQFSAAGSVARADLPPMYLYAAETAIQLAIAEQNENLREVYLEAYSLPATSEYIHQEMAKRLLQIFAPYLPGDSESDFYEREIGSAGIMRAYMARPCDLYFTLEKKISRFLSMSLAVYRVPEEEQEAVLSFIHGLNVQELSLQVMQELFHSLAMRFHFSLRGGLL